MKTNRLMLYVIALALQITATAADAPKLTFKFTKAHLRGALISIPATVNNHGAEVGIYENQKGVFHGYMLIGGKLTNVDDPNGTNTNPQGMQFNSENKSVGYYTNSSGNLMGFLYDAKTKKFSDVPGPESATSSVAEGINDQGWIDGFYTDSSGVTHGFLLQGATYTTLDPPGTVTTYAYGVNNNGDVALTWLNSNFAYEGSLYNYKSKKYTTINVPGAGASGSEASFINNEGDVTFWWFDSDGVVQGALCIECGSKSRRFYKFGYPKALATYPNGINDRKGFAGNYQNKANGPTFGFTATF